MSTIVHRRDRVMSDFYLHNTQTIKGFWFLVLSDVFCIITCLFSRCIRYNFCNKFASFCLWVYGVLRFPPPIIWTAKWYNWNSIHNVVNNSFFELSISWYLHWRHISLVFWRHTHIWKMLMPCNKTICGIYGLWLCFFLTLRPNR
jgi:hypothetical protein